VSVPDLDEREAEPEAGEQNAAAASDSGAGLPGSALDAGDAVVDGDNNGGLFPLPLPLALFLLLTHSKNRTVILRWGFVR
jgi:hypothetical protein